jgi:hypothetical protein
LDLTLDVDIERLSVRAAAAPQRLDSEVDDGGGHGHGGEA